MNNKGKLYLIPVPINEQSSKEDFPVHNLHIVHRLTHFIAEDPKTARRCLKVMGFPDLSKAEISVLNEHTKAEDLMELSQLLDSGAEIGLMSDAGCPGIADPGDAVVKIAHQKGIEVIPLSGPSSIVLSIMASGFNGQNFAFNGYLPVDPSARSKKLKELELLSKKQRQAQFFIETPYRNEQMLQAMMQQLHPDTRIFIGKNLQSDQQFIRSLSLTDWKKTGLPALGKVPVVFGLMAGE